MIITDTLWTQECFCKAKRVIRLTYGGTSVSLTHESLAQRAYAVLEREGWRLVKSYSLHMCPECVAEGKDWSVR